MRFLLLVLATVTVVGGTASAQSLVAKGKFREEALNTITNKFGELKSIETCFYRGQWAVDGKWDDKKVSLYAASAFQKFEGAASTAELTAVTDLAKSIAALAPENDEAVKADLKTLAEAAATALKGKKVLVSTGKITAFSEGQKSEVKAVVFSNKKTKEFLSLGIRPTCSK